MNVCIQIDPRICNGKPVIAGTRIPVTVILDQMAAGCSRKDIKRKYPGITDEQISGVLEYCRSMIDHTELELQASAS